MKELNIEIPKRYEIDQKTSDLSKGIIKFKEWCLNETEGINDNILDKVIFGTTDNSQMTPNDFLTERETMICCNLIQWLGSPVGQWFLSECGFVKKEEL